MEFEEMKLKYEKLKIQFELFRRITQAHGDSKLKVDLSQIEQMVYEEIPDCLGRYAPHDFPKLYFDFKYEYERLREFILYEHLIGKKIIALGGGFSSGKSSFLNALMGKLVLPANIDPSTSVPTYIVPGSTAKAYGINLFESKVELEIKDMKLISHGFGEVTDEKDQVVGDEVQLAHLLKNIFLATPHQPYGKIAFLDTPGYSKPGIASYVAQTDAKIAKAHLSTSDYILWFVPVDTGTITEADLKFLSELNQGIPKLIIVSKVDKCTKDETEKVVAEIKRILALRGIAYVDVLAFSRTRSKAMDSEAIMSYLATWNKEAEETTFVAHFNQLFGSCQLYYERLLEQESRRLNRLNTTLTFAEDERVLEAMNSLSQEIKRSIRELKEVRANLKLLQSRFFAELKQALQPVGVSLPEPSDMMKRPEGDVLAAFSRYKQKQGIKQDPHIRAILWDAIGETKPILNEQKGGILYSKMLEKEIIEEMNTLTVDFKYHHTCDQAPSLAKMIHSSLREHQGISIKLGEEPKQLSQVINHYLNIQEE